MSGYIRAPYCDTTDSYTTQAEVSVPHIAGSTATVHRMHHLMARDERHVAHFTVSFAK